MGDEEREREERDCAESCTEDCAFLSTAAQRCANAEAIGTGPRQMKPTHQQSREQSRVEQNEEGLEYRANT